jgi:hypothetical protein
MSGFREGAASQPPEKLLFFRRPGLQPRRKAPATGGLQPLKKAFVEFFRCLSSRRGSLLLTLTEAHAPGLCSPQVKVEMLQCGDQFGWLVNKPSTIPIW